MLVYEYVRNGSLLDYIMGMFLNLLITYILLPGKLGAICKNSIKLEGTFKKKKLTNFFRFLEI